MAKMIALLLFAGLAVQPEIAHAGSVRITVTGMKSAEWRSVALCFEKRPAFPESRRVGS